MNGMLKILVFLLFIAQAAFAEEVKLLTWNVFMLPKPIKFSYQKERTDLIIKEILASPYDVIVLQEAFAGEFQEKTKKLTSKKYPHQFYLKRKPGSLTVYGSGVYYLSRIPMKELDSVYFNDCAKADCFASKGSALMEFTLPSGKKFQVASTHLQAGHNENSSKIRFNQLKQIQGMMLPKLTFGVPQFLVGDLNIDANHGNDYNRALTMLAMTSGPLQGELNYTNGYPIECYEKPGDDQKEWIDHIFTFANAVPVQVLAKKVRPFNGLINHKECPLSDHWGVEATLSL